MSAIDKPSDHHRQFTSPVEAFDVVRPLCQNLANVVRECPLPQNRVAGLMVMVAVHFWGEAMEMAREVSPDDRPMSHFAREIMELIGTGLDQKEVN